MIFNPSRETQGFNPRHECILHSAREGASAFRPRGSTRLILTFALINLAVFAFSAEEEKPAAQSSEQISDFSLVGYGEKGKKAWDLAGKNADIFDEIVKLKDVVGNFYGPEEDITLTAQRGDFNKTSGLVHLEQNVVIVTSTGAKLTTESLDWDRKAELVTTKDLVNIKRDNMVTSGVGAVGEMGLKQVTLEKNVKVDILPQVKEGQEASGEDKTVITCDGPLVVDYAQNIASFNNNVKVERTDSVIYSDKMDVFFKPRDSKEAEIAPGIMGSKIEKIIARGNVKAVRGNNISYSEEAIYSAAEKKLILSGRPKLIIYSTEDLKDASFGN